MPTGVAPQSRFINVLVGENTRIHSQLLADAIGQDRGLRVIGAASTAAEFLEAAAHRKPDVAVVSAGLDEASVGNLQTLRQFHAEYPEVPLVVLLDTSRREVVLEAFRCGARGIFSKNESLEQLRKCVRSVYLGQVWANSREVRFLLEALCSAPSIRAVDANGLELLSARERQVVQLLAEGMTNRAIGERMQLSPHTIKNYVLRIFDKLGVSNRVELLKLTLWQPNGKPSTENATKDSDEQVPVAWCQHAAERGIAYAQVLLAELYREGDGIPRDPAAAYFWYCVCERTHPALFTLVCAEKEKLVQNLSRAEVEHAHAKLALHMARTVELKPMKPAPGVPSGHRDPAAKRPGTSGRPLFGN